VNTAIFSPSGVSNGIGFAVPVDTVRRVVNQLIRFGTVMHPTFGFHPGDDRIKASVEFQLGRKLDGVMVAEVIPDSPAAAAGLEASQLRSDGSIVLGDFITHINGDPISQVEDLLSAVEERRDGEMVDVTIWRNGDPRNAENIQMPLTTRDKLEQRRPSYRNSSTRPPPPRRDVWE
jgi:S1-C subfamily serine protease